MFAFFQHPEAAGGKQQQEACHQEQQTVAVRVRKVGKYQLHHNGTDDQADAAYQLLLGKELLSQGFLDGSPKDIGIGNVCPRSAEGEYGYQKQDEPDFPGSGFSQIAQEDSQACQGRHSQVDASQKGWFLVTQTHDEGSEQQLHEAGETHHDCGEQAKVEGCGPTLGEHGRSNGIHVNEAHGQREKQGMNHESTIVGDPHQYIPSYVEYTKVIWLWVLQR